MKDRLLQNRLLAWFEKNKRDLPWRVLSAHGKREPYRVWLAEVMLQQTQVATVIPYFARWLARFPTLADFAAAPLDDVLKQWEGLGYYSRARNFHRAAQMVMGELGGAMPETVEGLLKLPGIGRYTAGAIASLAFNQDAPILDGNVKRVWARVFALTEMNDDTLWAISRDLLPKGRAGEFNEALMDLGATLCTPRNPKCGECPINQDCQAYAQGKPEAYPIKANKAPTPHKDIGTLLLLNAQGQALMGQRPANGLLGGLWGFVSGEIAINAESSVVLPLFAQEGDAATQMAEQVLQRLGLSLKLVEVSALGTVKHGFTHFKITRHVVLAHTVQAFALPVTEAYQQLRWISPADVSTLALTRSDQKIAALWQKRLQSAE